MMQTRNLRIRTRWRVPISEAKDTYTSTIYISKQFVAIYNWISCISHVIVLIDFRVRCCQNTVANPNAPV